MSYRCSLVALVAFAAVVLLGCAGGVGGSGSRHTRSKSYSTGFGGHWGYRYEKLSDGTVRKHSAYIERTPGETRTLGASPAGIQLGVRAGVAAAGLSDRERGVGTLWELHLTFNTYQWTFTGGYGRQSSSTEMADVSFGGWIAEVGRRLDFVPAGWKLDLVALFGLHGGPGAKIRDHEQLTTSEYGGWAMRPGLRLTKVLGRAGNLDMILNADLRYTYSEELATDGVRYQGPSLAGGVSFVF